MQKKIPFHRVPISIESSFGTIRDRTKRSKGNYKNGSDIDLSFDGEGFSLSILRKIDKDLEDLLLPYPFDLSIDSHIANEELIRHIGRVGIIFYQKNSLIPRRSYETPSTRR